MPPANADGKPPLLGNSQPKAKAKANAKAKAAGNGAQARNVPPPPVPGDWDCVATNKCGAKRNKANRTRCRVCNRDRHGRRPSDGNPTVRTGGAALAAQQQRQKEGQR